MRCFTVLNVWAFSSNIGTTIAIVRAVGVTVAGSVTLAATVSGAGAYVKHRTRELHKHRSAQ